MKKRVLLFLSVPFFLTAADVFAFPRAKGKLFKPSRVSTAHQAARLVEKFQREANISAKVQQARNIQRGKRAQISSELPFMISHLAQTPPIFHHRVTAVPKEAPVWKAVLPLRETHSFYEGLIEPFTGSSFVIEEEYKGKKYLWGVTAAHVAFLVNGFPAIYSEGLPIPLNIEFAAWGNTGMNDLVVVQQGLVLGVEGIEGTDKLITRCAEYKRKGKAPVLVKLRKPQQDMRIDLPTIGTKTVENARRSGFKGLAIHAGNTLIVNEKEVIKLADKYGMFIKGITPTENNKC